MEEEPFNPFQKMAKQAPVQPSRFSFKLPKFPVLPRLPSFPRFSPLATHQPLPRIPALLNLPKFSALPQFSFVPVNLFKKKEEAGFSNINDGLAVAGLIFGAVAAVSWIVIAFGFIFSSIGITLSVLGLKSGNQKFARIGLGLSVFGFICALWYALAVYQGVVNYNYFTNEFWEIATGLENDAK